MKKLLFIIALIASTQMFSQNIAFDFAFVDAENIKRLRSKLKNEIPKI